MNTSKICIVILHYNDVDMTTDYITNLLALDWTDIEYHIIVVDNASPDKSGFFLAQKYKSIPHIDILLSEKNVGFARGNNIGIQLASTKYNADLIIVSNSDIIIEDTDLPHKILSIYKRTAFDVFGPDIYSISRKNHQSPVRKHYLSVDELNEKIRNIDRTLCKLHILDKLKLYDLLRRIRRTVKPSDPDAADYDKYHEGVVLQGAFFVLSNNYLSVYPDGLYPGTFLYMEEDILNYRINESNLKSVYDPSLQVKHLDGASTHIEAGDRCKKFIYKLEQTRVSCLKMIEYLSHL